MSHPVLVLDQHYPGLSPVQFGYEECAPAHSFGPAVREYWLIHCVHSGRGTFVRDGVTHTVIAGESFVIPPHIETYYEADARDPWHYSWIGFRMDPSLSEWFSAPVLRARGMRELFLSMRECEHSENGRSAFLAARLWDLLSLLQEGQEERYGHIEKALHFMRAEYMNDISVAQIAARMNLDRSYFSTLFKETLGVSPRQYLIDLRLAKAAELMRDHGESPSTVAVSVGYPDLFHFSKAFKKKYGLSPRAWQRENFLQKKY